MGIPYLPDEDELPDEPVYYEPEPDTDVYGEEIPAF